jgi:hypothetical protein
VIISLGDQPVAGIDDLIRLLSADRIGLMMPAVVLHGTARRTVTVVPREHKLSKA